MDLVMDNILNESIGYYQKKKLELVGKLLLNDRGYLTKRHIGNREYLYLRKKFFGKSIEIYLGPINSPKVQQVEKNIQENKEALNEIRQVKYALKRLKVKNMDYEDFNEQIKELFKLMNKEGLWDEGLELIGSWCFKVYQNYLGVEFYPERTLDVDFAISVPYKGKPVKIGEKLGILGFKEKIDYQSESIVYESSGVKVEFLIDRKVSSDKQKNPYIKDLDIAPQALPYLKILLDNPITIKIRDLGKITVPSMEAFLTHKLIVADERRAKNKKTKDYNQAQAVARTIMQDPERQERLEVIFQGLHKKRQKKLIKSAKEANKFAPGASDFFLELFKGK